MTTKRAVILAAGNGSRMGPLTADRPKPMVLAGGRTLIDRQICALRHAGVTDITVVVGYRQERLQQHLGSRVRFIENANYRSTNSLYSLWLASEALEHGALVLNGDVLFGQLLLERLLQVPAADALLFDRARTLGDEEMKVRLTGPFVADLSKDMPADVAAGENVGLVRISREGARRLLPILDQLVLGGQTNAWAPLGFALLARVWPIAAVDTAGLAWTEIDTPEDLAHAERAIVPAIDALEPLGACA